MAKDISAYLVKGLGKKVSLSLAKEAAQDYDLYKSLLKEIEKGETTPSMKASWILSIVSDYNKEFPAKNAKKIIQLLEKATIGGVQRELLKTLSAVPLKEDEYGKLIDLCFHMLADAKAPVAVKYHTTSIIREALKKYPELQGELAGLLSAQEGLNTENWQRHAGKVLKTMLK